MTDFKDWMHDFFDLMFPRCCAVCGAHLGRTEREVCASCLVSLPYINLNENEDQNEDQNDNVNENFYSNAIARLFWGRFPIERAWSYLRYRSDSESHLLLMQLKYNHRPDVGVYFGRMMARDLVPKGFFRDIDCLMPLPLHWKRRLARGYNQSTELAKGIAEVTGVPVVTGCIERVRNNETQTHKSVEERIRNVENLFRLRRPIPYRHILLVDDVLTTGASLTACAQAILRAQPDVRFSVLTLAKA